MTDDTMRQTEEIESLLPLQLVEMGTMLLPPTRGRGKHLSPTPLVTKNPCEINLRSDQLTSRILLGLLDGKKYIKHVERNLAEYMQILPKDKGYITIILSPLDGESWDHVLASLHVLGDELVDTFLVLLAVALDTHGTRHITNPFAITADDILAICQKKKSNGSYSTRQRQNVVDHLRTLARASVRATLTLHDARQMQIESPLLQILKIDQPDERKAHIGYETWYLKIGDWAIIIPALQYQTAVMARKVLHYHAREQRHEKRLGRYLTLLYRINAYKKESRVKISMSVLLEQAGIMPDLNHPGRTQEAIESALKQLRIDGVIGPFTPLVENSFRGREAQERIEQHAYHWWDDYQRQCWLFEPPEYLRAVYQRKPRNPGVPD